MNRLATVRIATVSTILLLAVVAILPGKALALPASPANDPELPVVERAAELARSGHADQAIQLLQAALLSHRADLNARLLLADLYASSGQNNLAMEEFREALRLHPGSSAAVLALAAFYANGEHLDEAEHVLSDAVHRNPQSQPVRIQLAFVLAREHRYPEARANIRLAAPARNANARAFYFRVSASIYSGFGDLHAAAHAMEQALRAMPEDQNLQLATAVAEEEAGEWHACIRNAAPLFAAHPGPSSGLALLKAELATGAEFAATLHSLQSLDLDNDSRVNLRIRAAELLAAADHHAEAAEQLQEALTSGGGQDDALRYKLAVEQYRAGNLDVALDVLRETKRSAEVENLEGDIEEQKGDSVAAAHAYQNAISLNPREEQYWISLGGELLKYRAYQPALLLFQRAAELFPASPKVYLGLGMADYFGEKYDESVAAFLHAEKLDPRSDLPISYLGATLESRSAAPSSIAIDAVCEHANGPASQPVAASWCGALLFRKAFLGNDRPAALEAIRRLRIAVSLSPADPVAVCSLGHALVWTEQWAGAREQLESCVRLQPDSGVEHFELSRVYKRLGLMQAAQEQSELTRKATAERDRQDDMVKKFVFDMPARPSILPATGSPNP